MVPVTINVTDVNEPPPKMSAPTVAAHATEPKYKLEVSWTAPTTTGKPNVTDYDVQYKKSSDSTWTSHSFTGTGTSTTLTSLTAGTTYDVQVKAINDEGNSGWSTSGSKKTAENAAPVIPATATRSIAENSAANASIGAVVSATDADGDTLAYSLTGTDASDFSIDSATGQIKVKSALDYEDDSSYSVTVNVTDNKNAQEGTDNTIDDAAAATINVTDVNEPPAKVDAPTVTQNTGTPKTKLDVSWTALTTTDMAGKPAVNDYDVQYKKSSDSTWTSHSFSGTGTSTTIESLTEGTEYDVQVRAVNDEGNGAWSDSGKANTQDKNVHAEFPDTSATRSVAENTAAGGNVGAAVTANDTENHTLYYSLNGTDKDEFDIGLNTGQITVKTGKVPNYEAKTSYSVTVEVSDRKDTDDNADTKIDDTITVTINVTDVNEPPAKVDAPTVSYNKTTTDLDVSWTAPDMTGKPPITDYDVQYRQHGASKWTDAGFSGTETSTTLKDPDMGNSYEVQVRATNAEGTGDWSDSGTVITQGGTPGGGAVPRNIAENSAAGTAVGSPVTATSNPNKYTLTHTLSGTDASHFTVVESSGQIKVKSALDYETKSSYSVIVTVKAAEEGASIQSFTLEPNNPGNYVVPVTINVANENVPPAPAAPKVTATGTSADTTLKVSWTAPDMTGQTDGETITDYDVRYQKQGATVWTSHSFTGTSTTIRSQVGGVNYNVQVRAVNREGNGRWSPSGDLANVDPKLPDSPTRSIAENSAKDTNVGAAITATDPDRDADDNPDTLYYTMTGTDADKFNIGGNTGQITVKEGNIPDYEAKNKYSVTVSVSDKLDSKGNADTEIDHTVTVAINVTDVKEPPGRPGTPTTKTATTTTITATWT